MRRSVLVLIGLMMVVLNVPGRVAAQGEEPVDPEPTMGAVLCEPGAYLVNPVDCLPLGPSTAITDLAERGIQYPLLPLASRHPDPGLNDLSISYAKINLQYWEQVGVFGSLDAAVDGSAPLRYLPDGALRYISFLDQAYVNGGNYVMLASGEWVRASPAEYTSFQGLVFEKNPGTSFGWIVDAAPLRFAPGYASALTGQSLVRETVVPIYSVEETDGVKWYMVGINQWVERMYIRQINVDPTPPEGVTGTRWVDVNLYEQTLSVYENGQIRFATIIATGVEPYYTRPGLFQIYDKRPTETMTGAFEADRSDAYFLQDVPWTMYFDAKRALHGAYWRTMFGFPQSHGCINLSVGDSHWLYDWAEVGDWVHVWDPSGATPTDPAFYGEGGA